MKRLGKAGIVAMLGSATSTADAIRALSDKASPGRIAVHCVRNKQCSRSWLLRRTPIEKLHQTRNKRETKESINVPAASNPGWG
jgi:hypothetical protein